MIPKKLPFEEFKAIYEKVPRVSVDLIIKKDNGIILIKREIPPAIGKWHFPGGTILLGEKIEDTIKRIAKEEAGIEVEIEKMAGYMEFFKDSPFKNEAYGQAVSFAFLCKYAGGSLQGCDMGHEIKVFQKIPENTIEEHAAFLRQNHLME